MTKLIKGFAGDKKGDDDGVMKSSDKSSEMKDDKMDAEAGRFRHDVVQRAGAGARRSAGGAADDRPGFGLPRYCTRPGRPVSATDCQTSYLQFAKSDYRRAIDGQEEAAGVLVTETQEDAYQYYLRRSPGMVEHSRSSAPTPSGWPV